MKKKYLKKYINVRSLTVLAVVIALFNFLSTWILPSDIFLAYAGNIDTNELVNLVNIERQNRGLNKLTVDSRLVSAAQAKGEDMLAKDYWDHFGPNGESPWQFINSSGYDYVVAGENLAKDFTVSVSVHNAWMDSPSHKSNIINSSYRNIGVAAVTGEFQGNQTTIVVQMFGSLKEPVSAPVLSENSDGDVAEESLPTTGNEINESELKPPQIEYPSEGEILDEAAFDVKGTAVDGSKVSIFDYENELGNTGVEKGQFTYTIKNPLSEGEHILSAICFDEEISSERSEKVKIQVDTIPPEVILESFKVEFKKLKSDYKQYGISLVVQGQPISVVGEYEGEEIVFNSSESRWEAFIEEDDSKLSDISILAYDQADNFSKQQINGETFQMKSEKVELETEDKLKKWFSVNVLSKIFTRTVRGKVNFLIAIIILVVLVLERIMLQETGLTKISKNNLLHLPVFAVLIFVALIGSGGEIL